jgi:hypothetical protein
MEYLKIWTSFRDIIEPLSDGETGRLFRMMMLYAETGEEPEGFAGNERFLWPTAKQTIDFAANKNETMRQNGSKGGRPKTKENQTEPEETKENQTEPNETYKDKEYDKEYVKDKEKENTEKKKKDESALLFAEFWSEYPKKRSKPEAQKAFEKINPDRELLDRMITAIRKQNQTWDWQKDNGQYIPYPATWLHNRQWEDEVKPPAPSAPQPMKPVVAQQYEQRDYLGTQDEARRRMIEMMRGEGL